MFENKLIKDFSGHTYEYKDFLSLIKSYDMESYDFYIGTDSQIVGERISIVTCICPRKKSDESPGRSGRVFYLKERIDRRDCPTLRSRMLLEAYRSIEAAIELEKVVNNKISIHLDVGASSRSKTRAFHTELEYLVTSQGYDCEIKPNSWAASACSDRVSKT